MLSIVVIQDRKKRDLSTTRHIHYKNNGNIMNPNRATIVTLIAMIIKRVSFTLGSLDISKGRGACIKKMEIHTLTLK